MEGKGQVVRARGEMGFSPNILVFFLISHQLYLFCCCFHILFSDALRVHFMSEVVIRHSLLHFLYEMLLLTFIFWSCLTAEPHSPTIKGPFLCLWVESHLALLVKFIKTLLSPAPFVAAYSRPGHPPPLLLLLLLLLLSAPAPRPECFIILSRRPSGGAAAATFDPRSSGSS